MVSWDLGVVWDLELGIWRFDILHARVAHAILAGLVIVSLSACRAGAPGADGAPTFNKDVAPLLYEHCTPCHRPGQQAVPFPLLTYADAFEPHRQDRTRYGYAPDAAVVAGSGEPAFVGERRLSADDIDTIARWARAGAPEGCAAERRPPPSFPTDWELGTPDVIVTLPRPYTHRPGHHDVFRNIVLRLPAGGPRMVRAVEFRSRNRTDSSRDHPRRSLR